MTICTTLSEDLQTLEEFSRAKYLVLLDDNSYEIVFKEKNPALDAPMKRPSVAKECVKLRANVVIAPHGSLCYPSYKILKDAGVKILVSNDNDNVKSPKLREVTWQEVAYSSFLATYERLIKVFKIK